MDKITKNHKNFKNALKQGFFTFFNENWGPWSPSDHAQSGFKTACSAS